MSPRIGLLVADMRAQWASSTGASRRFDAEFVAHGPDRRGRAPADDDPGHRRDQRHRAGRRHRRRARPSRAAAIWRPGSGSSPVRPRPAANRGCSGISKRGNTYLRKLLIHGARAALPSPRRARHAARAWLRGLLARAHQNSRRGARQQAGPDRLGGAAHGEPLTPERRRWRPEEIGRRAQPARRLTMFAGGGSEMA